MRLRRAAEIRTGKAIAARADRWERALAELHRIDARTVACNGRGGGARNDAHRAELAEAKQRAAVAERDAALWRATAEVLRLERDIRREQAQRLALPAPSPAGWTWWWRRRSRPNAQR